MSCLSYPGERRRPRFEHYVPGISCPHCWDKLSEKTRRSAIDRQKQIELAKARNMPHPIGYNYKQTSSEA